jgi:hypothetical protein
MISYAPNLLVPHFDYAEDTRSLSAGSGTLLPADSNRVGVYFRCASAGSIRIATKTAPAAGEGYLLTTAGQELLFLFRDFGPYVGESWFFLTVGPPMELAILTSSYRPQR